MKLRGILIAAILLTVLAAPAMAKEPATTETVAAAAQGALVDAPGDGVVSESIMAFINKGKPIGHVIILLLVVAIFFVMDQLRVHLLEKVRGQEIYREDLGKLDRGSFEETIQRNTTSKVGRLLQDAMGLVRQSKDITLISAEAEFYREKEEHRFNTFEARMAFLADTAGGLGLLGTVWGIYRGFAAKSVVQSNEDLLAAMGIALVTTFMGIVVSVIINWMSTEMGAAFRGRIMGAMGKIDEYREVLARDMGRTA